MPSERAPRHTALHQARGGDGLRGGHGDGRMHLSALRVDKIAAAERSVFAAGLRGRHEGHLRRVLPCAVAHAHGRGRRAPNVIKRGVQSCIRLYPLLGCIRPRAVAKPRQHLLSVNHDQGARKVDDGGMGLPEAGAEVERVHSVAGRQQPSSLRAGDAEGGKAHRRGRAGYARQGHVGAASVVHEEGLLVSRHVHLGHVHGAGV
mmetsp:Transcript_112908/g.299978  ORF Transcript_112908/g.299978 Transcript_112908/m.299978 type:complete len:204 (+) Transcript_112908:309-920(+)